MRSESKITESPCWKAGAWVYHHPKPRECVSHIHNRPIMAIPTLAPEVGRYENKGRTLSMRTLKPAQPVAPYIGGKSKLAKLIIEQIESIPHTTYAEAFVGMGGVFLRRGSAPKAEIINDYSKDVANLFRILQTHYIAFLEYLKWQLTTRADFDRLMTVDPSTLTDIQRAGRFLYIQKVAFGGKVKGRNFGMIYDGPARFDVTKLVPILEAAHERLSRVVIECLDYKDFIRQYDRAGVLFYLDPPYYGNENDYGKGMFGREEFTQMATLLKGIKGVFILSLNDRPEVRNVFSEFNLYPVATTYTIAAGGDQKQVGELLITNTKLKGMKSLKSKTRVT